MDNKLTSKQEKFCQCVADGMTYADAYKTAYNVGKNTSPNTIYVKSSRMMDESKMNLRIDEIKQDAIKRNQVTLDQVLQEMKNWLFFDPLELINEDTEGVKRLRDMPKKVRMSLSEITVSEIWGSEEDLDGKKRRVQVGELKKIKFWDKTKVADQFMKKFGAYVSENTETSDNLQAIKEIIESMKK